MSDYSEDFDGSARGSIDAKPKRYDEKKDLHLALSSSNSNHSDSSASHKEKFEKNLQALREEIKALEIEQMQNIDTYDNEDPLEIADDSSEDDMDTIKKLQDEIRQRLKNKPRCRSRPNPQRTKLVPSIPEQKPGTSKNYSFTGQVPSIKRQFMVSKKDCKSHEVTFFQSKPKQIVSAVPDIRRMQKKNRKKPLEEVKTYRINQAIESFENDDVLNGVDWKKSVLESFVISGLYDFNWEKDSSVLTEEQIFSAATGYSAKAVNKTFRRLCKEMFYDNKLGSASIKLEIQRLLMARRFIVAALKAIHEREDLLIAILTLGKEAGSELINMHKKLVKLTKNIQLSIVKIKDSILALDRFIYFGEDYEKKIVDDERRIARIVGVIN